MAGAHPAMSVPSPLAFIPSPTISGFHVGPLEVHFYALGYLAGITLAVLIARRRWRAAGGDPELVSEVALWVVPAGIIGGRIYFDVTTPMDIPHVWYGAFAVWKGGLGIWGGVLAGALAGAWRVRRHGIAVGPFANAVAPALLVAQGIGRTGNYFNKELFGLGIKVAASTVWEILKVNGMDPARHRAGPTWTQFLRSQAGAILASEFFTVDLLDGTQAYVLAVIEHATRRIRVLGATPHPTGERTAQQARNLLMDLGEQAGRVKFMILDRGPDFTATFNAVLADAGIQTVRCNVRTPRMSAIAERWIGDAAVSSWTVPSSGTGTICVGSCASTRLTTICTGRTAPCTQPRR